MNLTAIAQVSLAEEGAITHFFWELLNSEVIELDAEPLAELQKETSAVVPGSSPEDDDLPCHPEVQTDESPGAWTLVILLAVATLGVLLGRSLVLGAPDAARFTPANEGTLELWAALVGVVCGYGLVALGVMTRWAWQVLRIFRPGIPSGSVVRWLLAILLTLSAVALVTHGIPAGTVNGRPVHLFSHQITGFTIAGGISTIPGLVGFLALRSLARNNSQWDEKPKCQILMAIHLRHHLRRLLGTFGLFLALYVVVTATRRQLVLGFYKDAIYPQNYALLIGLLLAVVLALFHVSATMAINWRCERLLDEYAPIPSPHADDISTPLKRRQDLATFLGADSSWQQTFQNGVFVLAPLLTALIGTVVPKLPASNSGCGQGDAGRIQNRSELRTVYYRVSPVV
jgi:hypothetical protein